MNLRPLPLVLLPLLALGLIACEEPKGSFGKAEKKNPGVNVNPQENPDEVLDFSKAFKLVTGYDKEKGELVVTLKLAEGFHAYAPGEEVGKPVSLKVQDIGGWKIDGEVQIPPGKEKDLGELGRSFVLEGDVPLKAKVTGGSGPIYGGVTVQVCTKKACDRPRQHPFTVPTA